MVAHMKTTIDIADALLAAAKQRARQERRTLRDIVEQGLRSVLSDRPAPNTERFQIQPFEGNGMFPGMVEGDWEAIREAIYPPTVRDDRP